MDFKWLFFNLHKDDLYLIPSRYTEFIIYKEFLRVLVGLNFLKEPHLKKTGRETSRHTSNKVLKIAVTFEFKEVILFLILFDYVWFLNLIQKPRLLTVKIT